MAKTNSDDLVLELIRKVKVKKDEIKAAESPAKWLTNLTIGYNPDSVADRIHIQTVTSQSRIVEIYTFLLAKEQHWENACKDLGLDVKSFYMGYSIDNWKTDLQTRAKQIMLDIKKKELEALEKRLDNLVTIDQRRAIELEEIQKLVD